MPRRKYPILNAGAEYLVMGYLMRRNIQTCKAFDGNAGYDLLCVNPGNVNSRKHKVARIQVKSRVQSDSDGGFMLKTDASGNIDFSGFDYLVVVFLNVAFWGDGKYRGFNVAGHHEEVEMYSFPVSVLKRHRELFSGQKLRLTQKNFGTISSRFKNDKGIEAIAGFLDVAILPDAKR